MTINTVANSIALLKTDRIHAINESHYHFEQGLDDEINHRNFLSAIQHYKKVKKNEDPFYYSCAQYRLGEIYFNQNKNHDALYHYSQVSYYSLVPYQYLDGTIFQRLYKNGGEKEPIKKSCNG